MKMLKWFTVIITIILFSGVTSLAQNKYNFEPADRKYRLAGVHSGNQIRTSFFNYGWFGRRTDVSGDYGTEWPINTGHYYVGDAGLLVGAEVKNNGNTFVSVVTHENPRGKNEFNPNNSLEHWGWEPIPGFAAEYGDSGAVAMSHLRETWPSEWPDKLEDANDPGWRGAWNGYFGKDQFSADQESYYWMGDNQDMEFAQKYGFYPDPSDTTRGGLGLLALVRGFQWSQVAAQNTIFWLYEITNNGAVDYDKAVFGIIDGTLIGGDGDTNDDLSTFNTEEDITISSDADGIGNTGWAPVGYLGYAFLESPGNALDGIDNDGDGIDGSGAVIDETVLSDTLIRAGDDVVLIDYETYERQVIPFPAEGLTIIFREDTIKYFIGNDGYVWRSYNGDTLSLAEKGIYQYNNFDDNLNGLIDELTEIEGNGIDDNKNGLIDEDNPHLGLKYKNYRTGEGLDNPMIDESREDGIDNDGDWNAATDDLGLDGKPGTGDTGEGDGMPTSGRGTTLPGEPNIDKTDIDESDQLGLTSFFYFAPFNLISLFDDQLVWNWMKPGYFDDNERQPQDGDFIYSTGYFPIESGQTERISQALIFGNSENEVYRSKRTVQEIYNNDYSFAKTPTLPKVWAVAGDKKVTLYWDDVAESSFDRITQLITGNGYDFEGYKIYRATYPTFDETGVVTNVFGSRAYDVPIAQYDKIDTVSGFFPTGLNGVQFYLGDETGLVHTYVDTTVENGFTYFYAVTAYDKGITVENEPEKNILPSETSKFATITSAGEIEVAQNVVVVTPEAPVAGYDEGTIGTVEHTEGVATGTITVDMINPIELEDQHRYQIVFEDTLSGGKFQTKNFSLLDVTDGDTLINKSKKLELNEDQDYTEGFKIRLQNQATVGVRPSSYSYSTEDDRIGFFVNTLIGTFSFYVGFDYPGQYEVVFYDQVVDTSEDFSSSRSLIVQRAGNEQVRSVSLNDAVRKLSAPAMPTNFKVFNKFTGEEVKYAFQQTDSTINNQVDRGERIVLLQRFETDTLYDRLTYFINFLDPNNKDILSPQPGDTLRFSTSIPFNSRDIFEFTVEGSKIDQEKAKVDLEKVKVVPNPYVATSLFEPRNSFSSGRGPREIHFIHLPQKCTIRIFTVNGDLVKTIHHNSPLNDGTAEWDLTTKDNLDIAYGVYVYHIEAPGVGEKVGKFAVIK